MAHGPYVTRTSIVTPHTEHTDRPPASWVSIASAGPAAAGAL